jgi:uncharacterized repeat protein (TIGR03837 family)
MSVTWDIFCNVVDNFGDIGVTWRLARQLVSEQDHEHEREVHLWVSDLAAFCKLCPEADKNAVEQPQDGVSVHRWSDQNLPVRAADVVIEAFGCQLPESYIRLMTQRPRPVLWLNLEYLSAEDWVAGCHGLPSLQPQGLQKYFFFPGFSAQTGGLLREKNLIDKRQRFQKDAQARQNFLRRLGVEASPGEQLVSLFAYENVAISGWLDAMSQGSHPVRLLVPEGKILVNLQHWLGVSALKAGDRFSKGQLAVQILPFVCQDDYDRLLWCCDFNAVRGEDSFVRAQWAGRPFVWHIYPQEEGAHLEKLDAFLRLYAEGLSSQTRVALESLWHAWNEGGDMAKSWQCLQAVYPELLRHSQKWCLQQASQTNLAAALAQFHQFWV